MNDEQTGAGAYKPDHTEEPRSQEPRARTIHLGGDRDIKLDGRNAALAAGAVGLGVLAFKGVSALLAKSSKTAATAAGHTGRLEPAPLQPDATPLAKDNAAPRFDNDEASRAAPFMAASDDRGSEALITEPNADLSARTPEHVPTDLMGDQPPTANDRAIDAFRPDPTAPVPPEMRDSLRPATGPSPSLAADRGTFGQGLSQTDGSK